MKPNIFCFIFFIFFFQMMCFSQNLEIEWEKQMNIPKMDMFKSVIENNTGGFTVIGSKNGNNQDFWMLEFNSSGDILWETTFGTEFDDIPSRLQQAPDSSYVMVGKTEIKKGVFQVCLFKLKPNGEKIWGKYYDDKNYGDVADVVVLKNGDIVITGSIINETGTQNIWLAGLNTEGNIIWEKIYGDKKSACAKSLKVLPDDGFFLAGMIEGENKLDNDLWLFRFDKNVDLVWNKQIKSENINTWPECICCSPDSNLLVVGWLGKCMNEITSESPIFDYDLFVTKLSADGEIIWTKNIDSEGSEGANSVVVRPDGNILLAGKKETSFLGHIGPWILLVDPSGEVLSEKVMPIRFNADKAAQIINTSDGGFLVVGPGVLKQNFERSNGWIRKFRAF